MSNFHPFKVVGRGSETQLQVGENLMFSVLWVKTHDVYLRAKCN